ncbi:hypothetical protein N7G274_001764 [Stereocaulon virgatum]|uniref:Rhodopsin domain-containing protein n=1 Tax=Stereocaulon virgatum TaxID=373712 RepID=A0ABR4AKN0_9LECA
MATASTGLPPTGVNQGGGLSLLVVGWTFCALSLIFTLLRAYVRVKILNSVGTTDVLLFVAMGCAIINASLVTVAVHAGLGRHIFELQPSELTTTIKYLLLGETLFTLSLVFSKMSICIILLHLLHGARGLKKKLFLYLTIGLLIVVSLVNVGLQYGQCSPTSKSWDPAIPGHCWDHDIQVGNACSNSVMAAWVDFSLAAFPITFIKDLKLGLERKFLLCSLMSVGVLAGACAVTRTVLYTHLMDHDDLTFNVIDASIWGIVEQNVSIIVACIPVLRPLFSRQTPKRIPENPDNMCHQQGYQNNADDAKDRETPSINNALPSLPLRTVMNDPEFGASGSYSLTTFNRFSISETELVQKNTGTGTTGTKIPDHQWKWKKPGEW